MRSNTVYVFMALCVLLPCIYGKGSSRVKRMKAIEDFVKNDGATISPKIKLDDFGDEGLGFRATQDIEPGEVLMTVPLRSCISEVQALNSPVGDIVKKTPELEWDTPKLLAVYLLYLKSLRDGHFTTYIDSLPTQLDQPIFWSSSELEELRGSNVLQMVNTFYDDIEGMYNSLFPKLSQEYPAIFPAQIFTLPDFAWALSIMWSRAFDMGINTTDTDSDVIPRGLSKDYVRVITPYIDFFNHNHSARSSVGFHLAAMSGDGVVESTVVQVRVDTAYARGDQVYINYGDRPSYDMLILYGFATINHPDDHIAITLDIDPSSELYDEKWAILKGRGYKKHGFKLINNGADESTVLALRVLTAGPEEFSDVERATAHNKPISHENEVRVWSTLLQSVNAMLGNYKDTLQEDHRLHRHAGEGKIKLSSRRQAALNLRIGEKQILHRTGMYVTDQLRELREADAQGASSQSGSRSKTKSDL